MGAGLPLLAAGGARARSNQYFYDTLGRLVSVTYPNGVTVTYVYDAAGNRVSMHAGGAPPPPPP
ncbi:RHS repeat domain-containing protein, partial [Brevundimonas sp. P7753]|uniref:RHS repeat domain-containing protein n=1 Tax=Brevundimonas sp. P7753 TaxID=2726982 RepID=UPI00351AC57F